MSARPAAFLDRDGTIMVDTGFVREPSEVRLIPGAADGIRRLNQAGWAVVVVTNQSGIARGILSVEQYGLVARRMEELLRLEDARIDATYMCPHYPAISGPCACRKPGLGQYRLAAGSLGLDLTRSIFIGDRPSDLLPATALGGRGILVLTGEGQAFQGDAAAAGWAVAADLRQAVATVLG